MTAYTAMLTVIIGLACVTGLAKLAEWMDANDRRHGRDIRTDRKVPPVQDFINRRTRS